jgi:hypothetical protein
MTLWLLWIAVLLPVGALLHFFERRLQGDARDPASPQHSAPGAS